LVQIFETTADVRLFGVRRRQDARPLSGGVILMSRIDVTKYPDAVKAMYGLERIARERGIERGCCT
jgi:hypothetical protein